MDAIFPPFAHANTSDLCSWFLEPHAVRSEAALTGREQVGLGAELALAGGHEPGVDGH